MKVSLQMLAYLFALWSFAGVSAACVLAADPLEGVNPREYVLYGEVTGYARAKMPLCRMDEPCADTWGVVLKVVRVVSAPLSSLDVVEFYRFEAINDGLCGSHGPINRETAEQTRIGTKFALMAHDFVRPDLKADPNYRSVYVDHSYARNRILLNGSSYGAFNIQLPQDRSIESESRIRYRYPCTKYSSVADFEVRKDFARLERATGEKEALEVLKRLAECPFLLDTNRDSITEDSYFGRTVRAKVKSASGRAELTGVLNDANFFYGRHGGTSNAERESYERRRAKEGDRRFQLILGSRFQQAHRYKEALDWMTRSARQGFLPADLAIADLYEEMAKDARDEEAESALREKSTAAYTSLLARVQKRALSGDPLSTIVYADMLHKGLGGLEEDRDKAQDLACKVVDRLVGLEYETEVDVQDCP